MPAEGVIDDRAGALVLGSDQTGLVGAFTVPAEKKLIFLRADGQITEIDLTRFQPAEASYEVNRSPVLLDIDGDQTLEVLVTFGPQLLAFSAGGALTEGFPIEMPAPAQTQPLVASLSNVDRAVVFVGAEDGYIHAFEAGNQRGQVAGFPLPVGSTVPATPLLHNGALYAVDPEGQIRAWTLQDLDTVWWGGQYGDPNLTGFVEADGVDIPGTESLALLADDQTYNWPNPIRNGETFFRLAPAEDIRVTITIVDAAGGLVDKLDVERVPGGTSSDIRWQTDAASGLYYARVKAVADDGTAETRLIRMAIVR